VIESVNEEEKSELRCIWSGGSSKHQKTS